MIFEFSLKNHYFTTTTVSFPYHSPCEGQYLNKINNELLIYLIINELLGASCISSMVPNLHPFSLNFKAKQKQQPY